jgi:MOSC domain-containing protein YiiM
MGGQLGMVAHFSAAEEPGNSMVYYVPNRMGNPMELLSVNIGVTRTQPKGAEFETTGIYKVPASGRVEIGVLGIEGDFIGDIENHGGPDQAIYVYGDTDYEWWSRALGHRLEPGTFGENLTILGLQSAPLAIGDRLRLGSLVLEVSAPRIPCSTLARRMADPLFVKKFRRAERPGVYCRVLHDGAVRSGDAVMIESRDGSAVGVLEMFRHHYHPEQDVAQLLLAAPISTRARADIERRLAKSNSRESRQRF